MGPRSASPRRLVTAPALVLALTLGLPVNAPARAAQITVTVDSTADQPDQDPGNGLCDTDTAGCTLRAAIMEANAYGVDDPTGGNDDVVAISLDGLAPGSTIGLTMTGGFDAGSLDIEEGVTITTTVAGITVDATGLSVNSDPDRVFEIDVTTADLPEVTIENVTVTGGSSGDGLGGGGIFFGYSGDGILRLRDVDIIGNTDGDYGGGLSVYDGTVIAERTLIDGNDAPQGGGVYLEDGNLALVDSQVTNNVTTGDDGGGIYMSLSSDALTLTRTAVDDNIAEGDGGGLFLDNGAPVTVTGGSISGNVSQFGDGGGIHVDDLDALTLTDANVDRNVAEQGSGGALYVDVPGPISIVRGSVSGNDAYQEGGGGISLQPGADGVAVNGTAFVGNTAFDDGEGGGDGGAIFAEGQAIVDVRNARFEANHAGRSGGAIHLATNFASVPEAARATIRLSTFADNTATRDGGAIGTEFDNSLTAIGSTFTSNVADVDGGAIHLEMETDALFRSASNGTLTRFIGNRAGGDGGAVSSFAPSLVSLDVRYDDNVAGAGGGAVWVEGPDGDDPILADFTRGRLLRNVAGAAGGAIAGTSGQPVVDVVLTDVVVQANEAPVGGGIHAEPLVRVVLDGGAVRNNEATVGSGGGVFAADSLAVTRTTIEKNRAATSGGGVAASSSIRLIDVTVADNEAVGPGGGLALAAGASAGISGSTFARNASPAGGGLLIGGNSSVAVERSTFTANDSAMGAAIRNLGTLTMVRTTITFNTSGPGGASLVSDAGSTVWMTHSLIACQQENACIFGGTVTSGGHNLTDDPDCLIPGAPATDEVVLHDTIGLNGLQDNGGHTDTHSVRPESVAIDHGATRCPRSPIDQAVLTEDQRGFAGLVDGDGDGTARCDAGAYEYAQGVIIERSVTADERGPVDGKVELHRTGDLSKALTVRYDVAGTATPTADYRELTGTVRFKAGQERVGIVIRPVADEVPEPTETVTITLLHGSAYTLGLRSFATVRILDAGGEVTIRATDPIASEDGNDPGTFTVRRSGPTEDTVEVFLTFTGTAVAGTDYPLPATSVVIPAGSARATVTVRPTEDGVADPGETVIVTLEDDPVYRVGAPRSAQITIGDAGPGLARYAGVERKATAVEVSRATWPDGGAATVVVARADLYPDALSGGPLASRVGGPMLLTDTAGLDPLVSDEIVRLGATKVVLLGGPVALSEQVEADLAALGVEVERIGGDDRFETAGLIAGRVVGKKTLAYITEGSNADVGRGWPDAVSVAPLAAFEGRPILLVTADTVPPGTEAALAATGVTQVRIIGGTAAVGEEVEQRLVDLGLEVERYAGPDRFATSLEVANLEIAVGMNPKRLWLATGARFPDALVAGPAVAAEGGVLVLAPDDDLDRAPTVRDFIGALDPSGLLLRLVGGPAAISDRVEQQLREVVGL